MQVLYISDLHGSTAVWKKACKVAAELSCDSLIVGGDWLGKELVNHIPLGDGNWLEKYRGTQRIYRTNSEKDRAAKAWSNAGVYVIDSIDGIDEEKAIIRAGVERLNEWLSVELASTHKFSLILSLGNDDPEEIDTCLFGLSKNPRVINVREEPVEWKGICFVGMAYVPPTPWRTYRECPDDEIYMRIMKGIEECGESRSIILIAHAPPYGSSIDGVIKLDEEYRSRHDGLGFEEGFAGSKSVRRVIESGRVILGLHGHIHEKFGVDWINGVPVCNPGSEYWTGTLQGYLINLEDKLKIHLRRIVVS